MRYDLLDIPAVRAYLNERILCQAATTEKRVALTFDDGPHPRHTPALLYMLAQKGIPATFFVVGRRVRRFAHVLERVAAAGHEIGNHTNHHAPLSILPTALIRREIKTTEKLIVEAVGRRPQFLRPPMGWFNRRVIAVAKGLGYRPVIGSIHPRDSRNPGVDVILERIRRRVEPGAIIILHDGGWSLGVSRRQTIEAADRITDELLADGYHFDTLSDLAGDSRGETA
jgi:peptidoglycan/xylan/chitin deacetylase (PgdA/CDA1 family)